MRTIHLISLFARLALMVTLVLGLLYWIAQIPALSPLLILLVKIPYTSIHGGFGLTGALFLFILSVMVVRHKEARWFALLGVLYAFLLPAFGLTQTLILVGDLHWAVRMVHLLFGIGAMYLALEIEKRSLQIKPGSQSTASHGRATVQAER